MKNSKDFSRRDFGGRDSRRPSQSNINNRSTSQLIEKIETLNAKLDKIINLLSSVVEKKSELVKTKTKKNKKSKMQK